MRNIWTLSEYIEELMWRKKSNLRIKALMNEMRSQFSFSEIEEALRLCHI